MEQGHGSLRPTWSRFVSYEQPRFSDTPAISRGWVKERREGPGGSRCSDRHEWVSVGLGAERPVMVLRPQNWRCGRRLANKRYVRLLALLEISGPMDADSYREQSADHHDESIPAPPVTSQSCPSRSIAGMRYVSASERLSSATTWNSSRSRCTRSRL
ncbi:hypothetical protein CONPUDRAFT_83719, partial [Coniophora puteana RWD-64-598 SS2]